MKQNKIPRNEYIIQPKGKTNPYKHDVIYSDLGQWKYPGQVTRIPSNQITMQGVPYPVQGIDDTGYSQMMYPGMNYQFPGNYVTEYPMARYGGGLPKAQNGIAQTPEKWGKEIRNVEHQIGNPNTWTLDSYKMLQDKLNEYKAWRENTPEGKAVIDYHNEPNEYVIPLPSHLQVVPKKPFGGQNTKTHTHMANGGWLDKYQGKVGGNQVPKDRRQIPQSGMVIDKRTNEAYYFGDKGETGNFPVLTGLNPDLNVNTYSPTFLHQNPQYKNTPVGYYIMETPLPKSPYYNMIYNGRVRPIQPIQAFGKSAPESEDLSIHSTFNHPTDPSAFKIRNKLYSAPGDKRYISQGCINCKKESFDAFTNAVPKDDTLLILDSKNLLDLELLKKAQARIKKKQDGGWLDTMQKGGRTPIVVDDKNNPRLKAYNDSLDLYNLSQKAKKLFDVNPSNEVLQGYNKKANDLASKSKIKPIKLQLSGYNQDYPKNFDPGTMEEPWMVTYKKPVQPYIYKKPEEKEQSRTDIYTDKDLYDKAYKAEQDSAKLYEGYLKNIEGKKKTYFEPPHMKPQLVETGKMKNGLPVLKEIRQSSIWGHENDKIKPIGTQWVSEKYNDIIGYDENGNQIGGLSVSNEAGYNAYKKPVVHNVYQPPPPEEEPIKDTIPYKPKPKSIKSDTTRQWNFNGINPIMEYFDGSHKIIGKDYYKDLNSFKKGEKIKTLKKEYGGLLKNEYKRGGQKGLKKYTSKNIQSSVNDIMLRNETLFGPAGKKRYKPGLKYKSGGGWLDNLH
jgi:hypothetical protein